MTKTLQRVKFQILVYLSDWTVTRDVNKNKLLGVRALDKKTQERKKDEKQRKRDRKKNRERQIGSKRFETEREKYIISRG